LSLGNGVILQESFGSFWSLVASSGLFAQLVLVILVAFSVFSWTIIIKKFRLYREVREQSGQFYEEFSRSHSLSEVYQSCERYPMSPLAGIFKAGYQELQHRIDGEEGEQRLSRADVDGLERALARASATEMTALEGSLSWLATTGAVTPFIGLFGTVIGIINAFRGLGEGSTTTIQAVAPGISEALVATAAGLFAAIPAVVAYNHFLNDLKVFGAEMDDFSAELANLVERSLS
jgi:biopolymer transport protein TolQ